MSEGPVQLLSPTPARAPEGARGVGEEWKARDDGEGWSSTGKGSRVRSDGPGNHRGGGRAPVGEVVAGRPGGRPSPKGHGRGRAAEGIGRHGDDAAGCPAGGAPGGASGGRGGGEAPGEPAAKGGEAGARAGEGVAVHVSLEHEGGGAKEQEGQGEGGGRSGPARGPRLSQPQRHQEGRQVPTTRQQQPSSLEGAPRKGTKKRKEKQTSPPGLPKVPPPPGPPSKRPLGSADACVLPALRLNSRLASL